MSTGNFLQRFYFKWKYAILITIIISSIAAILSFQANRWIPQYTLSYSNVVAQQFEAQIYFKAAHYRFPNNIILKDVKVLGPDKKTPMLQASRMIMKFSFPLFSPAISLHEIITENLAINFPSLKDYLIRHGEQIHAWTKKFPQGNIRLLVPNGQLYPKGITKGEAIPFKIDLTQHQGHLSVHGFWDNKDKINFELIGMIQNSGFDLDKLSLEDGRSSVNLWGKWYDNTIHWKGFIFYNKFYILDINGDLNIQHKDIILKQLSFTVDGDAVEARGHCLKQNLFQCDADITYWRGNRHLDSQRPFKNINLHLRAQNTPQGPSFKGWADLDHVHLDFEGLKILIMDRNFLKLKIKKTQSIFSIQGHTYTVPLENILTSFNFVKPYQKIISLSANMFAGNCHSRIFLDTTTLPWKIKSQGTFEGINIDQGLLSGTFKLQSSKSFKLSGSLALHHGDFSGTPFQEWAAKTLQMPSLDQVPSADFSCRVNIDGLSRMAEDVRLKSDDFDISGFFLVDADDLVSSQGSVSFSKKLLSESPIGRKIIGLVRGAWTLPFEFSLSGNLYRMNFQWDKSPLKDKVRQHMFSFFERMIDRRMDAHPSYKVTIPNESVSPG